MIRPLVSRHALNDCRCIAVAVFILLWMGGCAQSTTRSSSGGSLLKYVVYDFDGLDIGATDLPDGDYGNDDLQYAISANPVAASPVIGDRVLKADLQWDIGRGEFGKATMRFINLDRNADYLNVYIYNPQSNSGSATVRLVLAEDDNGDDHFDDPNDDKWSYSATVSKSDGWQLISAPLSSFSDMNGGGNGVLDAGFDGNGGMLFSVAVVFLRPNSSASHDQYYIDMLSFSEGPLPVGGSPLELPAGNPNNRCAIGALSNQFVPTETPDEVESVMPKNGKLKLVNWFMFYSTSGTTANMYPGDEVQNLLDRGYTPIITWEMMYNAYSRLDPVQPTLDELLSGKFDGYLDGFASKIKSYNGTVILRILHEFEGDWYCWSLTHNGKDPSKYIAAWRHIVDRFRAAGASNVKWMWCLNAEPKPYVRYNWVVSCYPGDEYVDIVATDIYNHPDYGTPPWKSFRYTMAESYYYLVKYFSHKPLYVCEVGCRERSPGEPVASQTKGEWLCAMSSDLKSYFSSVQALVFFSMQKEHDWRINSSEAARAAVESCIWTDPYYGGDAPTETPRETDEFGVYPNPFSNDLWFVRERATEGETQQIRIFDSTGKLAFIASGPQIPRMVTLGYLPRGIYIVEYTNAGSRTRQKIVKL